MSNLTDYIEEIKREVTSSLIRSANAYYLSGMDLFHNLRNKPYLEFQPAIGNLCIAVELCLKAIIAQKGFRYLYSNIPTEVQLMLTNPESLDSSFRARPFESDLKTFQKFNIIELNPSISLFYHFFPSTKQKFKPYLSLLSLIRNVSVHASIPSFQRYDLDRIAYISNRLFVFSTEQGLLSPSYSKFYKETEVFVQTYDAERVDRVHKAIKSAQEKLKSIEHYGLSFSSHGEWEEMIIQCPICKSDSYLYGYTELDAGDEDGPSLGFYADSFYYEECQLELIDAEDLPLAGIDNVQDRTDEIDEYCEPPDHHEYY